MTSKKNRTSNSKRKAQVSRSVEVITSRCKPLRHIFILGGQRSLQRLMPYAKIRTSEDVLDGSVQVEIIVPTSEDERRHAWEMEALKPLPRVLFSASLSLLFIGLGVWLSAALNGQADGI